MSQEQSLDPRINRLKLEEEIDPIKDREYFPTYEVFQQTQRGGRFTHVGSVHAPDPEVALVYAKEQYGRRKTTTNMWVVKTSNVFAFNPDDDDMFETAPEKKHREAAGFHVREKIKEYKKKQKEGETQEQ